MPYPFFGQTLPRGADPKETLSRLRQAENRYSDPDWKNLLLLQSGLELLKANETAAALKKLRQVAASFPLYDLALLYQLRAADESGRRACAPDAILSGCRLAAEKAQEAWNRLRAIASGSDFTVTANAAIANIRLALARKLPPAAAENLYQELLQNDELLNSDQKEQALLGLLGLCPAAAEGETCRNRWQLQLVRLKPDRYPRANPAAEAPPAVATSTDTAPATLPEDPLWNKLHAAAAATPDENEYRRLRTALKKEPPENAALEQLVAFVSRYPYSPWRAYLLGEARECGARLIRAKRPLPRPWLQLPAEELSDLGLWAWRNGANTAAGEFFTALQNNYPASPRRALALYALGRLAEDRGDLAAAERFYQQQIESGFDPQYSVSSAFKLGLMQLQQKKFGTAVETWLRYRAVIDSDWDRGRSAFWIGLAYQAWNKPGEAQTAWRAAAEELPIFFYPLAAAERLKADPVAKLAEKGPATPAPRVPELSPAEERHLRRAEYLLMLGLSQEARSELSQLASSYPAPFQLYWLQQMDLAGGHLQTFLALDKLLRQDPAYFNRQTLTLLFPDAFAGPLSQLTQQHEVDPLLVRGLIKQESAFDREMVSRAGAVGLMQLMPDTAQRLHRDYFRDSWPKPPDLTDPHHNLSLGIRYLRELLDRYQGNLIYALAAYNAGPHRIDNWASLRRGADTLTFIESIPFKETRDYVKLNLKNLAWYTYLQNGRWPSLLEVEKRDFRPLAPAAAPEPVPSPEAAASFIGPHLPDELKSRPRPPAR